MDEPDVSYGVSHLLNKFIAVQVHGSDSAQAKARLKRIAFTFLLGLDRNEEVSDTFEDPQRQRLALAGAILKLHRNGCAQEAERLDALSEQLQRMSSANHAASTSNENSDTACLEHADIMQVLLALQGSVDRRTRWQSKGSRGSFMEQLETMHQPLDALEQPKACSRPAQLKASSADGSNVTQMLVNMARKPHWQKEKLGHLMPSAARDTLLNGADLLRTMESQPETSKHMWEADSSDDSSDSDTDNHHSKSSPNAYAAPCMTIGAGTYGSGYLSGQGSLQSASQLRARNAAASSHALWGRPLDGEDKIDEGDLARAALLALQGVVPATVFLDRDDLETHELGHASLSKLISPIVSAGKLRAILDAFLADLSAWAGSRGTPGGPCLQGFAAVAEHMLRDQTSALQSVPRAVRARRLDELLYCNSKLTAGAIQQDQAYLDIISSPDDVTILEVSMHTRSLQAELAVLGSLCGFTCQEGEALPMWTTDGLQLLDSLYRQLITLDVRSAPLLQRLFQGAYEPLGEALADWLFHGEDMPHPSSPFAIELPTDLCDLLPEHCQQKACTIKLPGFLQPWRREILVAGLQLRLLQGLPHPMCQLAADLSSSATTETAALRNATGPQQAVNAWTKADAMSVLFLTFDSLRLAKVAAVQEQGQKRRDDIVSCGKWLDSLSPTHSPQQTSRPQQHAAKPDITSQHAAEHTQALQTVSSNSSEQDMQKKADSALRGVDLHGIHQIAADSSCGEPPQHRLSGDQQAGAGFSHRELSQRKQSGRWPQAKALPKPGGPTAEPLPGLGSPVPSEAEMSRQHAPSGRTRQKAKESMDAVSISRQQSATGVVQPPHSSRRDCGPGPAADAFDSSPDTSEDAPLPAVIEALVLRRVLAQYACTTRACLGCLEALQLQATLQAIQRYFFMGAGDWADALVSAYCSAGPSPEPHSLHACHSMLDAALQASAVADDRFGDLLRLKSSMPSSRGGVLPRRGCSLQLELETSWPLTAFLPPAVMQECKMIFEELLGLRSMCWRLARTWLDCYHHPGTAQSGTEALAEQRLRLLRSFRAAAAQLMNALLAHMLQGLHGPSLDPVLMNIQGSEDVIAARDAISAWSNAAMQACLLHEECRAEAQLLRPVLSAMGSCLDAIVVCMTACDDNMREAVLSFHVWEGLQRAILKFEDQMRALARRMKGDSHSKLQNLLLPLLVNDYWVQQPQ